ncbi:hypothetical protein AB0I81_24295 [Nonomuraea sp. NPDC050404]|uniref:hypothetical protein n=1 Tax=Nonomuraea sp. NPDC050404 TaxID=3155783 RepID=UPI0033E70F73
MAGALAAAAGIAAASGAPANATSFAEAAQAASWSRCNDISGSPLCISVTGNLNANATVRVSYTKNSGPERFVGLYLSACGSPQGLVAQGTVGPGDTIAGSRVRYIYFNSCWVGHMRIGNTQWTTGELLTR